ncbi:MAG TPA: 5-deoxy-glucuronate isomerase, partial [Vicinamibacterales bacterium]|nr:5-deoxy-glucuronate isomerase [Vicinamibacterales bacterium]
MAVLPISDRTCIVRNTGATRGRTRSIEPGTAAVKHLRYGRIVLGAADAPVEVPAGEVETALIALGGEAAVALAGVEYELRPYDSLYIPRGTAFQVRAGSGGCDLAEIAAPVERQYPVQFVSFESVSRDPGLHFETGGEGARRTLNILIGKNVSAGRLMAGVTFSQPGNWTSWPPHEHGVLAEEAYLFIDMPRPAFGVQLVYVDDTSPELATIVREGDVVLMPQGYHPNVAAPGHPINFLWMMAAERELVDRQFGVVNVHPDFASGGSGLDRGR